MNLGALKKYVHKICAEWKIKNKVHSNRWNTNSCWLTNNKGKITKFDKIKIRSQYFYPKGQEHQANSLLGFKIQANHMWNMLAAVIYEDKHPNGEHKIKQD